VFLDDLEREVVREELDLDDRDAGGDERQEGVDDAAREDEFALVVAPDERDDPSRYSSDEASASRALPRLAIALGRELRGALGDQGFRFADEGALLQAAGQDDLTAAAERVRTAPL